MGGEHQQTPARASIRGGSSPRGRGTPCSSQILRTGRRIIPRGRGTPKTDRSESYSERIIPAWAGNTIPIRLPARVHPDHPRVGGEHFPVRSSAKGRGGSSPRGRGTQPVSRGTTTKKRIIPAWAGNTPPRRPPSTHESDHPRVGGEHGELGQALLFPVGSSPRGRGTRQDCRRTATINRIIPAWAGNTQGQ